MLTEGTPNKSVRLARLRGELRSVPREALDVALLRMHAEGRIVLFRDDNTPEVTTADEKAALILADSPRHLLYLKG